MRFTTCLAVLAASAALFLGGCATYGGEAGGRALPQDLPANPDPCATYCKEWVPPVYRKVPVLKQTEPCRIVDVPYMARRTVIEDVEVRPREIKTRKFCGTSSEESVVQVRPGGYRWVQTDDGCWKHQYACPEYKWCNRVVHEEGIEYCVERPPEYETVVRTECEPRTSPVYQPAKYGVEYREELYIPGHWRWVAKYDACGPDDSGCDRRERRAVVVDRKRKQDCVVDGCARTN